MITFNQSLYIQNIIDRTDSMTKLLALRTGQRPPQESPMLMKRFPPRYQTFIHNLAAILEGIYPGNWDIQYSIEPEFKYVTNIYGGGGDRISDFQLFDKYKINAINAIIRFPEIQITNSQNESVTIRDLFVKVKMKVSLGARGNIEFYTPIYGIRTTMSPLHFSHKYVHSHVSTSSFSENLTRSKLSYIHFCMGDSDIINAASMLNGNPMSEIDYDMVNLLFTQIETFVKWESIEGGPYFEMKSLTGRTNDFAGISQSSINAAYDNILETIRTGQAQLDVDWNFYNGRYVILENDKFERNMYDLIATSYATRLLPVPGLFTVYKGETGQFYTLVRNSARLRNRVEERPNLWIPFRGQKIIFRVEEETEAPQFDNQKYLNPKVKEYVKQKLEYTANYAKVRETGITELNQSSNS